LPGETAAYETLHIHAHIAQLQSQTQKLNPKRWQEQYGSMDIITPDSSVQ